MSRAPTQADIARVSSMAPREPESVRRSSSLPSSCAPRGLSRTAAAEYIGISSSLFDEMVDDKRMPQARVINRRRVWDRHELDAAFDELPHDGVSDAESADGYTDFAA